MVLEVARPGLAMGEPQKVSTTMTLLFPTAVEQSEDGIQIQVGPVGLFGLEICFGYWRLMGLSTGVLRSLDTDSGVGFKELSDQKLIY